MTFTPSDNRIRNGVSPFLDFYRNMRYDITTGYGNISLLSFTGFKCVPYSLFVPTVSVENYSLTSADFGGDTNAVTAYYGSFLNDNYKSIDLAYNQTTESDKHNLSATGKPSEWGYFSWVSGIYDSVADAVSGVEHVSHNVIDDITVGATASVDDSHDYVTITAFVYNLDQSGGYDNYEVTSSDITLYLNGSPYAMEAAPLGEMFKGENRFWRTFNTIDFAIGEKIYYWLKLTEVWKGKVSYSGTGEFVRQAAPNNEYTLGGLGLSGDYSGLTRGQSLTSYHKSLGISAPYGSSILANEDYVWRDVINTSWTGGV